MSKFKQETLKPTAKVLAQFIATVLVGWLVWLLSLAGIDVTPETLEPLALAVMGSITALIAGVLGSFKAPSPEDRVVQK